MVAVFQFKAFQFAVVMIPHLPFVFKVRFLMTPLIESAIVFILLTQEDMKSYGSYRMNEKKIGKHEIEISGYRDEPGSGEIRVVAVSWTYGIRLKYCEITVVKEFKLIAYIKEKEGEDCKKSFKLMASFRVFKLRSRHNLRNMSEFADPVVAEATLDFLNVNTKKILLTFPTLIPQIRKRFLRVFPGLMSPMSFLPLFISLDDLPVLIVALEKVEKSSGPLIGSSIASIQKSAAQEATDALLWPANVTLRTNYEGPKTFEALGGRSPRTPSRNRAAQLADIKAAAPYANGWDVATDALLWPANVTLRYLLRFMPFVEKPRRMFTLLLQTGMISNETWIGEAGFDDVYKGQSSKSWQHYITAIKCLNQKGGKGKEEICNELELIFMYHHENIINFLGHSDVDNEMIIVNEYGINDSLDGYLEDTNKRHNLTQVHSTQIRDIT
ncbi:AP-5 complex subunit zeta-1 [Tanacetum coccineum]